MIGPSARLGHADDIAQFIDHFRIARVAPERPEITTLAREPRDRANRPTGGRLCIAHDRAGAIHGARVRIERACAEGGEVLHARGAVHRNAWRARAEGPVME